MLWFIILFLNYLLQQSCLGWIDWLCRSWPGVISSLQRKVGYGWVLRCFQVLVCIVVSFCSPVKISAVKPQEGGSDLNVPVNTGTVIGGKKRQRVWVRAVPGWCLWWVGGDVPGSASAWGFTAERAGGAVAEQLRGMHLSPPSTNLSFNCLLSYKWKEFSSSSLIPRVCFAFVVKCTTSFDTTGSFGCMEARMILYLTAGARWIIPNLHPLSCARKRSTTFPYLWNGEDFVAEQGCSGGEFLAWRLPLTTAQKLHSLHVLNPLCHDQSSWDTEQRPGPCTSIRTARSQIFSETLFQSHHFPRILHDFTQRGAFTNINVYHLVQGSFLQMKSKRV